MMNFRIGRRRARVQVNTLAQLRTAALRAITRLERPDGALDDINPHTSRLTGYALASMLTFDLRGEKVREDVDRIVYMIVTGKPERRDARRDWVAWELDRLGHHDAARQLVELDLADSLSVSGRGRLRLSLSPAAAVVAEPVQL